MFEYDVMLNGLLLGLCLLSSGWSGYSWSVLGLLVREIYCLFKDISGNILLESIVLKSGVRDDDFFDFKKLVVYYIDFN